MALLKTVIKFKLIPTPEQETLLKQSIGTARWAYNYALETKKEAYDQTCKQISEQDIRKQITVLKYKEGFEWLQHISCDIPKQAVKDSEKAYQNFFKGRAKFPRFKSKHNTN